MGPTFLTLSALITKDRELLYAEDGGGSFKGQAEGGLSRASRGALQGLQGKLRALRGPLREESFWTTVQACHIGIRPHVLLCLTPRLQGHAGPAQFQAGDAALAACGSIPSESDVALFCGADRR